MSKLSMELQQTNEKPAIKMDENMTRQFPGEIQTYEEMPYIVNNQKCANVY